MALYGDGNALYGESLYGTGAAYTLAWYIGIDWNSDETYTDESGRLVGLDVVRGRRHSVNVSGDGFDYMQIGTLTAILDNYDNRYNPWYAAGDLYGSITPGKFVKVQVTWAGTTYDVMHGIIDDIQPISGSDPRIRIVVKDGLQWLANTTTTLGYYSDFRMSKIMAYMITDVDWPLTRWSTDLFFSANTVQHYYVSEKNALNAMNDLADADLGVFFCAADGTATHYGRYTSNPTADTLKEEQILKDFALPQPWETVRNSIIVWAYIKKALSITELWRLNDTPALDAGETNTYWATMAYENNPVSAITVTCDATTDYTVNTASGGGGDDLTASVTVTTTNFGETVKLEVTNNSASKGYITLLKVRGTAVYQSDKMYYKATDATSQTAYGQRAFSLNNPWIDSSAIPEGFADYLLAKFKDPQPYPVIQLEYRPDQQFGLDLWSRVQLVLDSIGIDDLFHVGGIEHQWLDDAGQGVRTTFYLEPVYELATSTYWIFPALVGVDTVFGA